MRASDLMRRRARPTGIDDPDRSADGRTHRFTPRFRSGPHRVPYLTRMIPAHLRLTLSVGTRITVVYGR